MMDNEVFLANVTMTEEELEVWQSFSSQEGWDVLATLEDEYECAGVCYSPLFYMTKEISYGQPQRECLRPLFDDVFAQSYHLCIGVGAALMVSALLQLVLCGGMPADAGGVQSEENRALAVPTGTEVTVSSVDQEGFDTAAGAMKPAGQGKRKRF